MNDTDFMRKFADLLNESLDFGMDEFTIAYTETMLWAETDQSDDQGGTPLEVNYDIDSFSAEALERIKKDCANFQEYANLEEIQEIMDTVDVERKAGHDFWLTRVGHGAGFWDGDWPEPYGDQLTELSKKFGHIDVYVGDDGQLELM